MKSIYEQFANERAMVERYNRLLAQTRQARAKAANDGLSVLVRVLNAQIDRTIQYRLKHELRSQELAAQIFGNSNVARRVG